MATIQKKVSRGHTYWQIVESRRVNGKPRPIVLMHLGTAKGLLQRLEQQPGKPQKARVEQFGALAALWNIAEELDVVGTIDRHANKRKQGLSCGQYLLLAALNRCVGASSKAALYDWYRKTVLHRLMPTSKRSLSSQRFWDHMNYLDEPTIEAISEELTGRLLEKFNIDLRTLLFDATNFDTYIDTQTDCELAQRGHAKSKRKDLRIIGLALLVSSDFHVPLFWHVYPGNQNDAAMFGNVTDGLIARYRQFAENYKDITLVFDGGNTSGDNMQEIDCSDYHFITSMTLTHHKDLLAVPLKQYQSFSNPQLNGTTAYRTTKEVWGKKRTVVVTRSENLIAGQLAGIHSALKKKRALLRELKAKVERSQKPGAKGKGYTPPSLKKKLSTIAGGQYIREILKTEILQTDDSFNFRFWTDYESFEKLKRTRLGKRILCTDNHDWSTEKIILGSRAQSKVEDAFKRMKDPHWVTFCPTFHWTEKKLRVHAFYCVLALTMASLLQQKAAEAGIHMTIPALLEELSDVTEVINLHASQSGRGRFRAEYVLSERSAIQDKLCRTFNVYQLAHS